jgi:hypothetical protein
VRPALHWAPGLRVGIWLAGTLQVAATAAWQAIDGAERAPRPYRGNGSDRRGPSWYPDKRSPTGRPLPDSTAPAPLCPRDRRR